MKRVQATKVLPWQNVRSGSSVLANQLDMAPGDANPHEILYKLKASMAKLERQIANLSKQLGGSSQENRPFIEAKIYKKNHLYYRAKTTELRIKERLVNMEKRKEQRDFSNSKKEKERKEFFAEKIPEDSSNVESEMLLGFNPLTKHQQERSDRRQRVDTTGGKRKLLITKRKTWSNI